MFPYMSCCDLISWSRSYDIFRSRFTELSDFAVKIVLAFLGQSIWIDYVRKGRRWRKNSIILQQHKRLFWARNKFLVEYHARVFVWKPKMMKLLNVRQLLEVLSEKRAPIIHRYNNSPVVRANKLRFIYSSSTGSLYQSRKFVERRNL